MTKLTPEIVLSICNDPRGYRKVAKTLGVSASTVQAIRAGRIWGWVTGLGEKTERISRKKAKRPCAVDGCKSAAKSKGMCDLHYWRSKRDCGTPVAEKKSRVLGKCRVFLTAALLIETDDCILWPYGMAHGYGLARVQGRNWRAHVWVCTEAHGPKPFPKAHAAHSCGSRACVNKRHLRWATAQENIHDKALHGRQTKGESINTARLRQGQVLAIANDNRSFPDIAADYGCSKNTVRAIHTGESWSWLTGITIANAKSRQPRHDFSGEIIAMICADSASCSKAALKYGCSADTINQIRRGLRRYG